MNVNLKKLIEQSKITDEVLAALQTIVTSRAAPTPAVLVAFVGYVEPAVAPTDTQRNTAILAMLANLTLIASEGVV